MGFAIHWLRRKSKIPVEKNWTSGQRLTLAELSERYKPGLNPGVRLGSVSQVGGGYLAVIDLDVKSEDPAHRLEAMAWLDAHYPQAADGPCLISGRGNGSAHFYVRLRQPVSKNDLKAQSKDVVKVKMPSVAPNADERGKLSLGDIAAGIRFRPAWEISLLCEGRQSALVGAIHPDTENRYKWGKRPNGPDDFPLLEVMGETEKVKKQPASRQFNFIDVDVEKLGLREDQLRAVIDGTGVSDRSAMIFSLCMAMLQRKIHDDVILSVFTDKQYFLGQVAFEHVDCDDRQKAANWFNKYTLSKAKARVNENGFDTDQPLLPMGIDDPHASWQSELELGGKPPKVKPTFFNLRLILANRCGVGNFLSRDLFSLNDFFTVDTPWGNTKGQRRAANTDDALRIKKWLSLQYGMEAGIGLIEEILALTAVENPCHPLREYLDGLQWDGVERIGSAFKRYLGADMPEPYLTDVCRKFFLACVKRAYEPGCKFDHVPILEGLQGKGKSTFIRYLVGNDWFMDSLPSMADKDASLYLQGIWICELGELATINKSGNDVVKGFIARTVDKFRPPYGQRRADFPRTTLFIGTTDQDQYLNDPAGNRRFWPVRVNQCDFEGVQRDRDQLWAEAVFKHHFDSEDLWLTGESASQVLGVHSGRKVEDENEDMAEAWERWVKDNEPPKEVKIMSLFLPGMPFFGFEKKQVCSRAAARILRIRGYSCKHAKTGNVWFTEK